jgi:hypothetical protein
MLYLTPEQTARFLAAATTEPMPATDRDTRFLVRETDEGGYLLQASVRVTDAGDILYVSDEGPELAADQPYLTSEWADARDADTLRKITRGMRRCHVHGEWKVWDAAGTRARCASHREARADARAERVAAKRAAAAEAAVDSLLG